MSSRFGPESTNPRQRRAYAHAVISKYKAGEATYAEAFEAAYDGSRAGTKGRDSHFGRALGSIVVDSYAQNFEIDAVVIGALSPGLQGEIAAQHEAGKLPGFAPDALLMRPDAMNVAGLGLQRIIDDPIAEGFVLYQGDNRL